MTTTRYLRFVYLTTRRQWPRSMALVTQWLRLAVATWVGGFLALITAGHLDDLLNEGVSPLALVIWMAMPGFPYALALHDGFGVSKEIVAFAGGVVALHGMNLIGAAVLAKVRPAWWFFGVITGVWWVVCLICWNQVR